MLKIEDVDFTRAFTPEEQAEVNAMPREQRLQFMERHNSAVTMTKEEREKHYQSGNYPEVKYGPSWTLSPPKSKRSN